MLQFCSAFSAGIDSSLPAISFLSYLFACHRIRHTPQSCSAVQQVLIWLALSSLSEESSLNRSSNVMQVQPDRWDESDPRSAQQLLQEDVWHRRTTAIPRATRSRPQRLHQRPRRHTNEPDLRSVRFQERGCQGLEVMNFGPREQPHSFLLHYLSKTLASTESAQ